MSIPTNEERQDKMKAEYPLYPELTEAGKQEAVELIESFKVALKKAAEEVISDLHCDIVPYIESDSWTNFRNELMSGLTNYPNRRIQGEYDFEKIRQQIFEDFREEIIKDLDQDNLKRIEELTAEIEGLKLRIEEPSGRYHY